MSVAKIQFIGKDERVLQEIEISVESTRFSLSLVSKVQLGVWAVYTGEGEGESLTLHTKVFSNCLENVIYIRGFEKLPHLGYFYITQYPPRFNCFFPLENWPSADFIAEKIENLCIPRCMISSKLSSFGELTNYNGQNCSDVFKSYMQTFFIVSKKIVDCCIAFSTFNLPQYVLLWILDCLPRMHLFSERKKLFVIISLLNGNAVRKRREVPAN